MPCQEIYRRRQAVGINAMSEAGAGNCLNLNTLFFQNGLRLTHQRKWHHRILCAMHKLDRRIGDIR